MAQSNSCKTHHEVTLDKGQLVGQTLLVSVVSSSVNLVVVVVQTSDVGTGELGDFAGRATNTAANIEDLHSLLNAHAVGEVVLVTSNGLVERLAVGETAEVEGLAPTIFVEIGSEVVVAGCTLAQSQLSGGVCKAYCLVKVAYSAVRACPGVVSDCNNWVVRNVISTYSTLLGSLVLGRLVVPVLEVLVNSSLLGIMALGEHGGNTTASLGRLAVQGLVEGGIAGVILALEA